jgi:hypothetical protein
LCFCFFVGRLYFGLGMPLVRPVVQPVAINEHRHDRKPQPQSTQKGSSFAQVLAAARNK